MKRSPRYEYNKKYRELNKNKIKVNKNKWISANKDYYKKYRKENKEKITAYNEQNKDKIATTKKLYYKANAEKIKIKNIINKKKIEQRMKLWRISPKGLLVQRSLGAKRRAAKLQRTPTWSNLEAIKQIYLNCPKGMHVDHIIPLQGENVSGLHVHYNLQYLTPSENISKKNKFNLNERKIA